MAVSTIQTNNKLIKFTQEINREWVRENMFAPYMGEDVTSIIRRRMELKSGGEQMNIPLVTRLTSQGVSTGTLVGNEEAIDDYGMRVWLEWARNAVVTTKSEMQKDSADTFGEAKPLLSDWIKELNRDEIIAALMALPSETQPVAGVRVNGIQYDLATTTQRSQWQFDNRDRILFGAATTNNTNMAGTSAAAGDHAASLLNVDTTADKLTAANLSLLKRVAMNASPKIRPYMTKKGYEYYVAFAGINAFRDLKLDLAVTNKDARPRENLSGEGGAPNNPLFQDGDQIYDGVIVRSVPEISSFVTNVWTTLKTAGAASARVEPVFLCGQQAAAFAIGQMAKPTFRQEDDYGFIKGVGIETAYGIAKMFKKHPKAGTALKQWGTATGFFASAAD
jgi:Protein of unknown function (DUF4043)